MQFVKPPTGQAIMTPSTTLSPSSPGTPTPHYHVTLTSTEYDALRCSRSTNASSSDSPTLLPAPSTLGTSAHLSSSSPSWIINSAASSQMTETSSLLSSYHPTPSHSLVTIVDGRPCPIKGRGITRVTNSLVSLIFYVPIFSLNLLSISVIDKMHI